VVGRKEKARKSCTFLGYSVGKPTCRRKKKWEREARGRGCPGFQKGEKEGRSGEFRGNRSEKKRPRGKDDSIRRKSSRSTVVLKGLNSV